MVNVLQALDLQNELNTLKEHREHRRRQQLDKVSLALKQTQEQLKNEYTKNMQLTEQVADLALKETEQQVLLESSAQELTSISNKLKTYRETTQLKDDASKFAKAVSNVQGASDLTELTMLALKITEELKRSEANNAQFASATQPSSSVFRQ